MRSSHHIYSELGHSKRHLRILKIDIEGGEWSVLRQMLDRNTLTSAHVTQLVLEIHMWNPTVQIVEGWINVISDLKKDYSLFSFHENPQSSRELVGMKNPVSCCFELSFVRK